MAVSGISGNSYNNPPKSVTGGSGSELGKDAFLQLLVEQLKNQDPMNPMDNTQYIAQLTQFTSVEQLMNISTKLDSLSMDLGSASTLIGKTIGWAEMNDEGQPVMKSGVVDSIYAGDDGLYAQVGDRQILLSVIQSVTDASEAPDGTGEQPGDDSGNAADGGDGADGGSGEAEGAEQA
ncbi:flagellar hook assembly protein FlgD [Paenibacillus protaetiae]|uniref:Flagellar hook capping protein n=1 Tax=Paenibacillus protaetiae TaxID=2509456 RepID=A0A4P6ERU4_9BACL|nr:flagellar hook capping FlgD N-terminal domain-containing protein [Paenibacillus protaetiae]QAY65604.1 flagellar hook capping protein [Paenibacillus protaetiae]